MKRREFLLRSSMFAAGTLALPTLLSACKKVPDLKNVGIITNTIKDPIEKDWKGTLETLASWGYKYLEHGGTFGESAAGFLSFMNSIGMKSIAGGTSLTGLLDENDIQRQINESLGLGKEYLVCYWPWLKDFDQLVFDDIRFAAEQLNKIGKKCKEEGLKFAFHNHDKEFERMDDVLIYDYFMENTDPSWVVMEADMYWMAKGGADPVEFFRKYPGRFELIHMKDMNNETEKDFACVGSGIIDFQRIVDHADIAGMKYLIVEHDHPEHHMECARTSIEHILSLNL